MIEGLAGDDPGLDDTELDDTELDDTELATACRRVAGTYNHHSGTCRLGDPDAAGTVVAPNLSVLGTAGLFVADSSILPVIPRANTNLISMAIGYRAADLAI